MDAILKAKRLSCWKSPTGGILSPTSAKFLDVQICLSNKKELYNFFSQKLAKIDSCKFASHHDICAIIDILPFSVSGLWSCGHFP